jgi:hypothetical protein
MTGHRISRRLIDVNKLVQQCFALSTKVARDLLKGVDLTTLLNVALMLPAVFVIMFFDDHLRPALSPTLDPQLNHICRIVYYLVIGLAFMRAVSSDKVDLFTFPVFVLVGSHVYTPKIHLLRVKH